MRVFWLVAILWLRASAVPTKDNDYGRIHGENGWYIPRIDGSFLWVTIEEGESMVQSHEEIEGRFSLSPVTFYLYTRSNPNTEQLLTANSISVLKSHINPKHPTKIIIHGWTQDYQSPMNSEIRDAWLRHGDYNIIVVDWGRARSYDYASSVAAVPGVGEKVARMIDYLVREHGLSLGSTEVIGHSLGAHVAGYAGKNIKTGRLHAIIALDPAHPLFNYKKPNRRLNSDDADYVESIQTNGNKLGFLKPIGKGTFYPNGGQKQPGCGFDLTGACSHGRSCIYYAEAVRENNFPTINCGDYEDAVKKECGSQYSGVKMGAVSNAYMVGGDFYVPVHSTAPYGYGIP